MGKELYYENGGQARIIFRFGCEFFFGILTSKNVKDSMKYKPREGDKVKLLRWARVTGERRAPRLNNEFGKE